MKKNIILLLVAIVAISAQAQKYQPLQYETEKVIYVQDSIIPTGLEAGVYDSGKCAYERIGFWKENGNDYIQYEANVCQRWEWLIAGSIGFEPETKKKTYGVSVGGEYRFCFYETIGLTTGFEAEMRKLNEFTYMENQKAMIYHPAEWSPAILATAGIHTGHLLSPCPGKGVEIGLKGGIGFGGHQAQFPQADEPLQVRRAYDFTLAWKGSIYCRLNPNKEWSPVITLNIVGGRLQDYELPIQVSLSVGVNLNLGGKKESDKYRVIYVP